MANRHIVIDARNSGTSTGRYTDKLIENISAIDHTNKYTLLLKKHRIDIYTATYQVTSQYLNAI
jgi:ABC-type Fe2+-enterobactin transport system substrate-binding protein